MKLWKIIKALFTTNPDNITTHAYAANIYSKVNGITKEDFKKFKDALDHQAEKAIEKEKEST